ncbi:colanic acid biosynthesis glycosyltransferase WcaL [Candidatus Dependentiae bacterium]|nr:MAG: colanic acid biosynthesis glycosyltransferase WcaL [Candidatus Dependentiae bacterium]
MSKEKYIFLFAFYFSIVLSKPLSVLFVTNKFPYEPRQYIDNQITGFIDAGIDVTILADRESLYTNYPLAQKYKFKDITFYKELPKNKRSFDIIYCQFPDMAKKMLIKRKNKLISGVVVGCFRAGCEFDLIQNNIDAYKQFFQEIDLILVVCNAFKKRLIAYGCPKEKILVHHSAIDVERFEFHERRLLPSEPIKIISIGRLHRMKGYNFTIEAIKKVKELYPNIQYNIYGMGSEYELLKNMIEQYNLQETVFLKGYCEHDRVPSVLCNHHIFILGSYTTETGSGEGIPNAFMEAMATGMPVIGTKHSGIPELLENGVTGFVAQEQDANDFSKKLVALIEAQELWPLFGKNGRDKVLKEHNKLIQNKKLKKLFETIKKQ